MAWTGLPPAQIMLLGEADIALVREFEGGEGLCALLSPATRYAAEIDRGIGFAQVLQERFPAARLLRVDDMPETDDEAYRRVRDALAPVRKSPAQATAPARARKPRAAAVPPPQ